MAYRLDPLRLHLQLGLIDGRLALNTSRLGPRLSLSFSRSSALHCSTAHAHTVRVRQGSCQKYKLLPASLLAALPEGLQLQQLLPGPLSFSLVHDLLTL